MFIIRADERGVRKYVAPGPGSLAGARGVTRKMRNMKMQDRKVMSKKRS